jgi:uncharacterized protein
MGMKYEKQAIRTRSRWLVMGSLVASAFVLSGSVQADLQSGVIKYQAGDYKGAMAEWQPLAVKNDPNALFNIGQAYRLGRGVAADTKVALDYYMRAANLGHVAAQGNAGTLLYFSDAPIRDRDQAIDWWQKASANGDPRANYMLGVLHFNGEEVEKDWPRAYALTTLAKEAGLQEATSAIEKMDKFLAPEDKASAAALIPSLRTGSTSAPAAAVASASTGQIRKDIAAPSSAARSDAAKSARAPMSASGESQPKKAMAETVMAPADSTPDAPAPAQEMASAASWKVQLGAFGSESAAQRAWGELQGTHASLKAASPYFDPTGTGAVRLQAGGFPSRAGADALCSKLKAEQMSCFVVKPAGK